MAQSSAGISDGSRQRAAESGGLGSPLAAVEHARDMLNIERNLGQVSESLFDTIIANEVGPATALAARMLGDFRVATEAVHATFERARSEFSSYDGSESPRSWALGYVAEEAVKRSGQEAGKASSIRCSASAQNGYEDPESALHCLKPEGQLAVILTDVLGMTEEAAARVSRVDLHTVRQRAASARSWIARHLCMTEGHGSAADGATG